MQFHIEIDEGKTQSWVQEDDANWAAARSKYQSVQDKDTILAGIQPHMSQHQSTAEHIYRAWLNNTLWADRLQEDK